MLNEPERMPAGLSAPGRAPDRRGGPVPGTSPVAETRERESFVVGPAPGSPLARIVALVVTLAATLAAGAIFAASPAAAASSIGGSIKRSEILQRAEDWYKRRNDSDMTYSQSAKTWDVGQTKQYRRDCSGFITMAWHMSDSDLFTETLVSSSLTTTLSSWTSLLPGDALVDNVGNPSNQQHAILFGGWEDSAKTKFWFYSFGATPVEKVRNHSLSATTIAGHAKSDYKPIRYTKIVGEGWPSATEWCTYRVHTPVNERTGPGTVNPSLLKLGEGTQVVMGRDGMSGSWRRATDWRGADGKGGWISGNYLSQVGSCFS